MTTPISLPIAIGPGIDLHPGIHSTLLTSPPPGVTYLRHDASHLFFFPPGAAFPDVYTTAHWGEFVSFPVQTPIVHSARWPVLNAPAWVADMDDFGYPLLGGRALFHERAWPRFRAEIGRPGGPLPNDPIRIRLIHMLRAYAHPSCRAILFGTQVGLARAAKMLTDFEAGPDGETFLRKSQVLGPAMPPLAAARVHKKWEDPSGTNVIFCGVGWQLKNGLLAVRVMAKMAAKHPTARFIYVGDTPPHYRNTEERAALPPNLRLVGQVPRSHVQTLFEGAHILFHPSQSESFGMVLLEAAAAGLAIVCAQGRGMEHLHEIVDHRGALTVNRDVVPTLDEEQAFAAQLDTLITDRAIARAKGLWNHARVESSLLSTTNRNAALTAVYQNALSAPETNGLTEQQLLHHSRVECVHMTSRQVTEAEVEFRERFAVEALGFRMDVETRPRSPEPVSAPLT
ncbi:MAG: glycosyltransferase [Polyangiaceae bacterium]|nr:glycosyltransferase [Polyangiaceae bacterium]